MPSSTPVSASRTCPLSVRSTRTNAAAATPGGRAVQRDHPVAVVGEVRDNVAAELAAASGDGDGGHDVILIAPAAARRWPTSVLDTLSGLPAIEGAGRRIAA